MASNVRIDIAAEFTGKPAFNKAEKSVSALEKTTAKLTKAFIGLFAAQKVAAFGKASVNAFMEDQKSAALLTQTVKNLGLAFAQPEIDQYIKKLEETSGVVDEKLRPSMQKLLTTTGSITKSQELLANAVDISRGSGVDLETVVADLSNAYVGNTKGLKKYALGLTQAELKTMSFTDIQKKFNAQFSGSSQAYLSTYAGKLELINTAADNAKETIGKGLLDAFSNIAGSKNDIQGVADAFNNVATEIADVSRGIGVLVGKLKSIPGAGILEKLVSFGYNTSIVKYLSDLGKAQGSSALAPSSANAHLQELTATANAAAQKKAELDAAKRAKALADAQTKQTKALKDQAALKKQSALFDIQQIQLVAALQGKLSDEDRKRVELQLALLQGNEAEAAKLSTQIANSIDQTGALAKYLQTLPDANNPFKNWDIYLKDVMAQVNAVTGSTPAATSVSAAVGNTQVLPQTNTPAANLADLVPNFTAPAAGTYGTPTGPVQGPVAVTVTLDSKVLAEGLQNQSLSGNQAYINRRTGGFDN